MTRYSRRQISEAELIPRCRISQKEAQGVPDQRTVPIVSLSLSPSLYVFLCLLVLSWVFRDVNSDNDE
ncbi:hypothetical protein E2C01_073084 [Portunus trituberculatus]|uniref:Uncharacterized protein n=1 Tax=Portunus trituberculatus TaxID=210409 RepID=A0A5B7I8G6_PORTR|nr:hypothetical protein [Portunus trituberculatus]